MAIGSGLRRFGEEAGNSQEWMPAPTGWRIPAVLGAEVVITEPTTSKKNPWCFWQEVYGQSMRDCRAAGRSAIAFSTAVPASSQA